MSTAAGLSFSIAASSSLTAGSLTIFPTPPDGELRYGQVRKVSDDFAILVLCRANGSGWWTVHLDRGGYSGVFPQVVSIHSTVWLLDMPVIEELA